MRAITYARVSTDAQERDGTSLDTQERACLEFARAEGWRVVESVRDAASGFSLDRTGIERVRRVLRDGGADVLLAYAIDRLARNQQKLAVLVDEVEEAGAKLEFVTERFEDTAVGKLILSVRGFAAEVEREKIVERTTRGKLERARSGRIPGGTGLGCYGYVYDPHTGHREIEPFQAEIVRHVFVRFAEVHSYSPIARQLNEAGIPSFGGGRWYLQTIRRMLRNEAYTGRLVYRRTKKVLTRDGRRGARRRRDVLQPPEQWIAIEGACPRLIDEALWNRVQQLMTEPGRAAQRPAARFYVLRGRLRCGICGAAMIGQVINCKTRPYCYYRCRHIYDKNTSRNCSARFVRADSLESGIWREIKKVLAAPAVVLQEVEHHRELGSDDGEIDRLQRKISSLAERERRLVRLFSFGEVDEDLIRSEGGQLRRERQLLEERLQSLRRPPAGPAPIDSADLVRVCSAVADWLDRADEQQRRTILEALQVSITATPTSATITGVLPIVPPPFITEQPSSRRRSGGSRRAV